jgi:hypothetical protein
VKRFQKFLLASALLLASGCRSSAGSATQASDDAALSGDARTGARETENAAGSAASDATSGDAQPSAPAGGVKQAKVFFFGHSLVDQDMPLMVGSMAAARGKTYSANGQVGWGTALDAHWSWNGEWTKAPLGFVEENRGRSLFAGEGKAQLAAGGYDVMVMTESNGHTRGNGDISVDYATRLARHARAKNPSIRVFLYSSWLDRKEFASLRDWQQRSEADVAWWESVADRVDAALDGPDILLIPGAAILSKVTRAIDEGKIAGLAVNDLFNAGDGVHVNDLGFYVIALAHYAAIFRESPVGLPVETQTEDGPAEPLSPAAAAHIQRIVWDYLQGYPRAGIAP